MRIAVVCLLPWSMAGFHRWCEAARQSSKQLLSVASSELRCSATLPHKRPDGFSLNADGQPQAAYFIHIRGLIRGAIAEISGPPASSQWQPDVMKDLLTRQAYRVKVFPRKSQVCNSSGSDEAALTREKQSILCINTGKFMFCTACLT